jgi:aldose 1-epimerase
MESIAIEAQSERAEILPGFGCHCIAYSIGPINLIASPPSFEVLREHPHRFGIPLLFPWPGRIAHGRFDWGGHHLDLPVTDPAHGHAIHGTIGAAPFAVVRRGPFYLTCELDWSTQPDWQRRWPYPFRLAIDYEVGNGLRIQATVHNTGAETMPFGFGLHPYFNVPLPGGTAGAARFRLPVRSRMTLDASLIPTGARTPAGPWFELGAGDFDELYSDGVSDPDGAFRAYIMDPPLRTPVRISAGPQFSTWVAFAPPQRQVLAIEPYTCLPDAFHLSQQGVASGLLELRPGQTWQTAVEIGLGNPGELKA